ncbi:lanC-like protein 3 homolog [Culicoides brevitarsis]|uniref:lanC-like protein 3 homolog n=1 Tax=Culicoides brevitarsis TaxID=469753 RepID=UPI00307B2A01
MAPRHFENPFEDYKPGISVQIPEQKVLELIHHYVSQILSNQKSQLTNDRRGDLYVGCSGIAFMFLKLSQSSVAASFPDALVHAKTYIEHSKQLSQRYLRRDNEKVSFLCGNAGIFAVSAAISKATGDSDSFSRDLAVFNEGFPVTQQIVFNDYGNDEILFGRAGFLSGIYWLNGVLGEKVFSETQILDVCHTMFASGHEFARKKQLSVPLMYECYGDQYIGAAHGISAIFHMFLQSKIMEEKKFSEVIKASIDHLLSLQAADGNFPAAMDEVKPQASNYRLVHWCHGAPGVIYVFAKAYLVFKESKYLDACHKCADLVWKKGLLLKGPGICHGIAGNGYVFLMMYRLTGDQKFLYRAIKFFEFLTNPDFLKHARTPDHPFSLYEGIAGTVCYLIDLLEPQKASFPFMEVF